MLKEQKELDIEIPLALKVGEIIDERYGVERILSGGSAGNNTKSLVCLCQDHEFQHSEVALKLNAQTSAESNENFTKEIELMQEIDNLHVQRMISDGVHVSDASENLYFTSEYMEKGSLDEHIGILGANHIVEHLASVACGVTSLHEKNIIHRDIKPSNIYINDSTAMLGDFGIAIKKEELDGQEHVVAKGTLGYVAPEIFAHESPSEASDVFSLGVTAYKALTGQTPWPSNFKPFEKGLAPTPSIALRRLISPMLRSAIYSCLEKDPLNRPTATEFMVANDMSDVKMMA